MFQAAPLRSARLAFLDGMALEDALNIGRGRQEALEAAQAVEEERLKAGMIETESPPCVGRLVVANRDEVELFPVQRGEGSGVRTRDPPCTPPSPPPQDLDSEDLPPPPGPISAETSLDGSPRSGSSRGGRKSKRDGLPASSCVLSPQAQTALDFLDPDLQALLAAHRLEQYAHEFFVHRVDSAILPSLTLGDLIEMGLPLDVCKGIACIQWGALKRHLHEAQPSPRRLRGYRRSRPRSKPRSSW
eukprot:TRINITY_DN9014_c0_g2_i1.p2 TRINITY_DN9014_c0_g2~~TRINITY_DN9014_c0_g2_i1.p2  ORF type:complete len:245 (+),score=39.92 TRINITY_DN9014_c0_g2_i1:901-1635(+)